MNCETILVTSVKFATLVGFCNDTKTKSRLHNFSLSRVF